MDFIREVTENSAFIVNAHCPINALPSYQIASVYARHLHERALRISRNEPVINTRKNNDATKGKKKGSLRLGEKSKW